MILPGKQSAEELSRGLGWGGGGGGRRWGGGVEVVPCN